MVERVVKQLPDKELDKLLLNGSTGFITIRDVLEHVRVAKSLKVRK